MTPITNLIIEHQCPQCGAPAALGETDRLFCCQYCRVTSYLSPRGVFRYVLPHSAPEGENLLFFPYWRFKGTMFFCMTDGVRHRFLDISHPAADSSLFPQSVGLRSQALKLRFVTPGLAGRFILPTLSMDQVIERLKERFSQGFSEKVFHRSHVGEALSLIYSPFYVRRHLYDAVLNQPIGGPLDAAFDPKKLDTESAHTCIRFLAAICPHCGADLAGKRDALVLVCKNCDSAWTSEGAAFKRVVFGHLPPCPQAAIYLPFWRIEAEVAGIELNTTADLVRAANLAKVVQPSMESEAFRFWAPAFKLRPQAFLRLATRITLSQPRAKPVSTLPDAPLHPVTLASTEAVEALKVTLADFIKPRRVVFPMLSDIRITPKRLRLVFVPFQETQHDLVHPELGLAVNRAMLATAGNM